MLLFLLLVSLLSLASSQCKNDIIVGPISVNAGGGDAFIVQSGGTDGGITINGNAVTLKHNTRIYIGNKCANDFAPDVFFPFVLLGKTFSFTADLSQVGCACNAALYLVSMPAYNRQGQPDRTKCDDYYCDANDVCGEYCPEMDTFEANNRALAVTPHRCDAPQNKFYGSCDRGGCGINTYKQDANAYGPGNQYTINTMQPFRVSITFASNNGQLNKITTVLTQSGKTFSFTHDDSRCGGGYLASLTSAFSEGMVVAISYWGTTGSGMSWLDVPPCQANENCNTATTATFSEIALT